MQNNTRILWSVLGSICLLAFSGCCIGIISNPYYADHALPYPDGEGSELAESFQEKPPEEPVSVELQLPHSRYHPVPTRPVFLSREEYSSPVPLDSQYRPITAKPEKPEPELAPPEQEKANRDMAQDEQDGEPLPVSSSPTTPFSDKPAKSDRVEEIEDDPAAKEFPDTEFPIESSEESQPRSLPKTATRQVSKQMIFKPLRGSYGTVLRSFHISSIAPKQPARLRSLPPSEWRARYVER